MAFLQKGGQLKPGLGRCLLILLPSPLPRKTASLDFHRVLDREAHSSSGALRILMKCSSS